MEKFISTRVKRTALSRSCPCPVFVRIFRKVLSGVCPVSGLCPDFLSAVRILSRFFRKSLSGVCLSDRTRTRQRCPDFYCRYPLNSCCSVVQHLGLIRKKIPAKIRLFQLKKMILLHRCTVAMTLMNFLSSSENNNST